MKNFVKLLLVAAALCSAGRLRADNPIVQTWYTSDPAPMVHNGRIYLYTGHDEDNADFFWMQEWRVYSSDDLVNWTDHGSPLALEDFAWADDRAWAAQCIERDGKFYWYICAHVRESNTMGIGVAVGNSPLGPFKDAVGKPLYEGSWDHIDPTVLIDDDGRAYLCWGNPRIYFVELNRDMISLKGEVRTLEQTVGSFGAPAPELRKKEERYPGCYVEGPWLSKRNGQYYLLYAAGGIPEHIAYSMAPTINGPWRAMGPVMPLQNTGSFTNHCGVTDFKGNSYFFYHTGRLPNGGGFGRSVAVEQFVYNPDGTFPTINMTEEGAAPVGTLDPYRRVEAETMAFSAGLKAQQHAKTGVYIDRIHNGDYIKLRAVDFGTVSPRQLQVRAASALRGGRIEVRLDAKEGPVIATVEVGPTGGWERWQTFKAEVEGPATGVHDLYLCFVGRKGPELFSFDWWKFVK